MKFLFLLGRLLYGGFFIYNGVNHFVGHEAAAGHAASKGVPQPHVAVSATGAMLLAGGASIVLGLQPKIGTGLIFAFLLGVSPQMHDFWTARDPHQRMNDMVHFTKNMALLGGALMLMSRPEPWPLSASGAKPGEVSQGGETVHRHAA